MNELNRELESALKEQTERVEKLRNKLKEISSLQETLSGTGKKSRSNKRRGTKTRDAHGGCHPAVH